MTMGKQVDEPTALHLIERAIELGVNFIDTADMYVNGVTEQIVAKAIKGRRDSLVIASKGGHIRKLAAKYASRSSRDDRPCAPEALPAWNPARARARTTWAVAQHLMQSLEGSLRRLGTDYLDIYYAHMPDYDTPLDETLRAMDDMVRQGKVRYLGCSNFRAFQLAGPVARRQARTRALDVIQPPFNLLARDVEYECCRFASRKAWRGPVQPMAAGLLSGKYDKDKPPLEGALQPRPLGYTYNKPYWNDPNFAAIEQLKKIAAGAGVSLPLCARLGTRQSGDYLDLERIDLDRAARDNAAATEVKLPRDVLAACDAVWLGVRRQRQSSTAASIRGRRPAMARRFPARVRRDYRRALAATPAGRAAHARLGFFPLVLALALMALAAATACASICQEENGRAAGDGGARGDGATQRVVLFVAGLSHPWRCSIAGYALSSFLLMLVLLQILGIRRWYASRPSRSHRPPRATSCSCAAEDSAALGLAVLTCSNRCNSWPPVSPSPLRRRICSTA